MEEHMTGDGCYWLEEERDEEKRLLLALQRLVLGAEK